MVRSNAFLLSITTEWRRQGVDRLNQSLDVAEPVGESLHLPAVVRAPRLVVRIDAVWVALLCQDLDNPRLVDVSLIRPNILEVISTALDVPQVNVEDPLGPDERAGDFVNFFRGIPQHLGEHSDAEI